MLELSVDNTDELDTWKASFLRAGVYPEREQPSEESTVRGHIGYTFTRYILCDYSRVRRMSVRSTRTWNGKSKQSIH